MRLIIDVPEDAIKAIENGNFGEKYTLYDICGWVMNGTPLPMGHWSHDGSRWMNRFICSECEYKLFDEPTNYCPNCGCRMEGGEDD